MFEFEDHGCEDLGGIGPLTFNYFENANLSYSDLSNSILVQTDFTSADLTGALLVDANLSFAVLCWANFSGADLTGADLTGTAPSFVCGTLFTPEGPPKYDCDTIWTDTFHDVSIGGIDPQEAGWILLNPPCALATSYGTVGPIGSLVALSDRPKLGEPFTVGLDNPLGTSTAGSIPLLLVSKQPDPHFFDPLTPDGTLLPGFGMDGGAGELLVSLRPADYLTTIVGETPWTGPGEPAQIHVKVPSNPALLGLTAYTQGVLFAPGNAKLSEGAILLLGS